MAIERRTTIPPDYQRLLRYLTDDQVLALGDLQNEGWDLYAVRRPSAVETLTLILSPNDELYVMKDNGELEYAPDIRVRKSA